MRHCLKSRVWAGVLMGVTLTTCNLFAQAATPDAAALQGCRRVPGVPGPEDVALDRATGMLYVSSHDRRNFASTGKISVVDLNRPIDALAVQDWQLRYPADFRPHGMSLVKQEGVQRLYVISHTRRPDQPHTLEVFEQGAQGWFHQRTLSAAQLDNPNDLHVMSDGRIFVSNDHGPGGKFSQMVEDLFWLKRSRIAYFDGSQWSYLGPALSYGNGIYIHAEGGHETLYRASVGERAVVRYALTLNAHGQAELTELGRIPLAGGPDNLEPDGNGSLHVAVHPSFAQFFRHMLSPGARSPSRIQRFSLQSGKPQTVYDNAGEEISGASTGLVFADKLVISQVFEDFLLVCPMPR